MATIVTMLGEGADDGARYVAEFAFALPPADWADTTASTPHDALLHPLPESDQVSAGEGFEPAAGVSVATIPADAPAATLAGAETWRVKLLVMVTAAEVHLDGSATLWAVRVVVAGKGKICGAVKSPLESIVPHPSEHAAPDSVQRIVGLG
jgi:hypothetical protein